MLVDSLEHDRADRLFDACLELVDRYPNTNQLPVNQISPLKSRYGGEFVAVLAEIFRLQPKARAKFGSGVWLATERSLQQATAWQVAALKATWLPDRTVFDLCCGLGGDAMQISEQHDCIAVDRDPRLVAMAAKNHASNGVPTGSKTPSHRNAKWQTGDVTAVKLPPASLVHIDPDRRPNESRTSNPDAYQPSWAEVTRISEQVDGALVKLAPAARVTIAPPSHRCWVSLSGSVREQSLMIGAIAEHAEKSIGQRSATIVKSTGDWISFEPTDDSDASVPKRASPGTYLFDPDAAIRAAGLTEAFARRYQLESLSGPAGFLTGDTANEETTRLAVARPVLWLSTADDRKLRRELRARDQYPETIKVRGTDHNPAKLHQRYRQCGQTPIDLWIGRAGSRVFAAATQR